MDILFMMVYDSLFYILITELRFYGRCHPCLYSVLVPINQQDGKILPTVHLAKFTQSSILWYYCSENLLNNLITIDFSHACIYLTIPISVWLWIRLISAGLKPVMSLAEMRGKKTVIRVFIGRGLWLLRANKAGILRE